MFRLPRKLNPSILILSRKWQKMFFHYTVKKFGVNLGGVEEGTEVGRVPRQLSHASSTFLSTDESRFEHSRSSREADANEGAQSKLSRNALEFPGHHFQTRNLHGVVHQSYICQVYLII